MTPDIPPPPATAPGGDPAGSGSLYDPTGQGEVHLLARARSGDPGAMGDIYQRYRDRIYGLARRVLGDDEEAADITQETFARFLRDLRGIRGERAGPWLFRVARNLATDRLRARTLRGLLPFPSGPPGEEVTRTSAEPADEGADPAAAYARAEGESELATALARLPTGYRVALHLRETEDLSYREMAEVLGTSVPAVESLLFRSRRRLREEYESMTAALVRGAHCRRVEPWLSMHLDRELDPARSRQVEVHLVACDTCQGRAATMRRARHAHRALAVAPIPAALAADLDTQVAGWISRAAAAGPAAGAAAIGAGAAAAGGGSIGAGALTGAAAASIPIAAKIVAALAIGVGAAVGAVPELRDAVVQGISGPDRSLPHEAPPSAAPPGARSTSGPTVAPATTPATTPATGSDVTAAPTATAAPSATATAVTTAGRPTATPLGSAAPAGASGAPSGIPSAAPATTPGPTGGATAEPATSPSAGGSPTAAPAASAAPAPTEVPPGPATSTTSAPAPASTATPTPAPTATPATGP